MARRARRDPNDKENTIGSILKELDPALFETLKGMAKRPRLIVNRSNINVLPTVEEVLAAQEKKENKPDILLDENVASIIGLSLMELGFRVVRVTETKLAGASDEEVFAEAQGIGMVIITHDQDYLNSNRFDLAAAAGVVILPDTSIPSNNPFIHYALLHLKQNVMLFESHRIIRYMRKGCQSYGPPFRPDNRGILQPERP
jgi:predicted nuclease of predicted toxin-antitoxin system